MAFDSKQYAFKDLTVVYLGRTITGFQGVKYKVSTEKEPVFGRGNKALAIQTGNEKIEGELKILQSELHALETAVKAVNVNYKLTDISADLIVTYGSGDTAVTDIITGVEFSEYEKGMDQGDKFMEVTLPFMALDVRHNV